MTNLTEQWKNGQLKGFDWYYVKFKTGEIDICWFTEWSNDELGTGGQYFDGIEEKNILEILAPVPSYEEYLEMEGHCAAYSDINQWQKEEISAYKRLVAELKQENTQLKELLKECHDIIYETAFKLRSVPEIDKCNAVRKQIREILGRFKTETYYVRERAKDIGEE